MSATTITVSQTITNMVTVGTADLRAALAAVTVHADETGLMPELERIRLIVDPVNVTVVATDRFTAGLAIVSTIATDSTELFELDLMVNDVKKILSIFKAGKEKGDDPQYLLRLDARDDSITITDCSGMIDGRALKVPRLPSDESPLRLIPGLLRKTLASDVVLIEDMLTTGEYFARFKAAAAAYHEALVIESRQGTKALLIACGESFLGLLMPRTDDEESFAQRLEWKHAWLRRLPKRTAKAAA